MSSKKSLVKTVTFFICFYTFLALFFSAMMAIFYLTIDDRAPKWKLDQSLIGTSPTLSVRPLSPYGSNLIQYNKSNEENVWYWMDQFNSFLELYHKKSDNLINCDFDTAGYDEVCDFYLDRGFEPCSRMFDYGFKTRGACVILKLNQIFGWIPDCYQPDSVPKEMPDYLKVQMSEMQDGTGQHNPLILVDCYGVNAADKENVGTIVYFPGRGFHKKYFPYRNTEGYLRPLVALYFENIKRGTLVHVECKAWAHNIIQNRKDGRGFVRFYLSVDD